MDKISSAFGTHTPKASFSPIAPKQIKNSKLCEKSAKMPVSQDKLSLGFSTDELADMINETAVDIFGDIILDNDGGAYRIIDDYTDIFNN